MIVEDALGPVLVEGDPERARDVVSTREGNAWRLRYLAEGPRPRDSAEPLAPPNPGTSEGGPGPFGHVRDARTGHTLRLQVFLLVTRAEDRLSALVPHEGELYLPATNLTRWEDPWHAARRIARDWFHAPLPLPRFLAALRFPPDDADPSEFLETVYEARLHGGHPVATLPGIVWAAAGREPRGRMFVDQASVWRRLPVR